MSDNKPQKTTVFALRIPITLLAKLAEQAERESRTVSNKMRLILQEAVNGKKSVR